MVDNTNEKIDELALEYGKTTEKVIKTAAPAKRENVGGSVGTRQSPSHGRIVQTGGFTLRLDDQEFREEIQPGTRPVEKRGKDAVKKPAKKRKPTALKDLPKELKELANSLKGPVQ
ncbi:hypothetical protein E4H12_15470 [Candidatus Thorarchaeota archaeon]|nr:MAG: hypothetical protein E4H12_15470 [Candidatus Thorarchaeota archaeon]